jgi:hypothetical protein
MKSTFAKKYAMKKAIETKSQSQSHQKKNPKEKETLTPEYQTQVKEHAYLGNQGYTIPKSCLSKEDLLFLQKSLELEPKMDYGVGAAKKTAFPVYRENDKKIYIPRFYGESRYGGIPIRNELSVGDLINVPFTPSGFIFFTSSINTFTFSANFSSANDNLPTAQCKLPLASFLKLTMPVFKSVTTLLISVVMVPDLGLGIKPF